MGVNASVNICMGEGIYIYMHSCICACMWVGAHACKCAYVNICECISVIAHQFLERLEHCWKLRKRKGRTEGGGERDSQPAILIDRDRDIERYILECVV